MTVQRDHEHWFVDHDDPRWLICGCGQYAVRTRNITGDRIVRLIEPPRPMFIKRSSSTAVARRPQDVDVRERDLV